jgi:chromosome segregation ATPase
MTNIPPADDGSEIDSDLFEDWLVQAADSKGVSKQELMNQMLSSYWILDELTGLVGETEANTTRQLSPEDSAPASESVSRESERSESTDAASEEKPTETESAEDETMETGSNEDVTEERIREIQLAIRKLVEDQSEAEARASIDEESADSPSADDETSRVVDELRQQCETLGSELDDLESRQDTQFDRLSDELQLALDRVNELEETQERLPDREDIEAIVDDIRTIDGRLEELHTADRELESRMDREFDSIEELFRRVLNTLDDLESELDATTESYQEDLEPIKERIKERKRLEELKNDALNRGVRKGSCERCDRTVDLALLESADCPNCTAHFTGIDDSGWNPLRPATLETGSAPTNR